MSCDHELANEWAHCSGNNASYITKPMTSVTLKMRWHDTNQTNTTLGFTSQLDLLVKPCLFLVGSVTSHHILQPMRRPIKTKTKAMAWLLLTVIWKRLSKRVLHSNSSPALSSEKNVPPHFQAWNLNITQISILLLPNPSILPICLQLIGNNDLDTCRAEEHSSLGSDSIKKSMSFAVREMRVANKAAWPLIKNFKKKQTISSNYLLLIFFFKSRWPVAEY